MSVEPSSVLYDRTDVGKVSKTEEAIADAGQTKDTVNHAKLRAATIEHHKIFANSGPRGAQPSLLSAGNSRVG